MDTWNLIYICVICLCIHVFWYIFFSFLYAREIDLLEARVKNKMLVKTHASSIHQIKELTNVCLSFATQRNQQPKSSSNLKQLNKGTHERPCWCVKIGGMFGVLSQTQLLFESLDGEYASVIMKPMKLCYMKWITPQAMVREDAMFEGIQGCQGGMQQRKLN